MSAVLILWAPFIGQVRRAIRSAFPGHFSAVIGAIVAVAIAAALVFAASRIGERRLGRYLAIAASLVLAGAYAMVTATGNPDVDAVERFHFVEYGLVTWLFYRAWRPLEDGALYVLPLMAGLLVGTIDEWFQWFIPARIGELRDVLLNGVALACGLLFSVGVDPPACPTFRLSRGSRRLIGVFAAAVVIALALFLQIVHLGYNVEDDVIGSFRSRYPRAKLDALARDRAVAWSGRTIPVPPRLSMEDQYFSEALWHVQRRNERWDEGNVVAAWRENLILEKYFAPVLDTPSYVSWTGHRWPAEQRADAQARAAADTRRYVSDAQQYPIYAWPRAIFWSGVGLIAATILLLTRR